MSTAASPPTGALLATTAPSATIGEAADFVRAHYGIEGQARLLTSERDQNFHLLARDGRAFVLKITNAAEPPAVTNLQTMALLHVAAKDPSLPVPRPIQALDGRHEIDTELGGGHHVARLLSYLPGTPLHRVSASPTLVANAARCLASLDVALRDFVHPAADHALLWDLKRAAGLRDLVHCIEGPPRRALAERFLDNFESNALPVLPTLRAQVIHNDFNPHNVLVDPEEAARVTGVIDFGDMVDAPLINEVAIAASYQESAGDDGLAAVVAFARAYHAALPLQEAEVGVLFDLVAVRHVMTVAITEWRARRYPANGAYILRNNPRAWAGLQRLAPLSRPHAQERLRRACGME